MIDKTLYKELASLSPSELTDVKLNLIKRIRSAQEMFARGEITELELQASTVACGVALSEVPLFPGAQRSLTISANMKLRKQLEEARK